MEKRQTIFFSQSSVFSILHHKIKHLFFFVANLVGREESILIDEGEDEGKD